MALYKLIEKHFILQIMQKFLFSLTLTHSFNDGVIDQLSIKGMTTHHNTTNHCKLWKGMFLILLLWLKSLTYPGVANLEVSVAKAISQVATS